jgi:2-oxoglutarate-dependent dioxygenase
VAFTRLTVHGSGPNQTSQARVAYGLQYHREDVSYFDLRDNQWKLLVENRRFQTEPVAKLGPQ